MELSQIIDSLQSYGFVLESNAFPYGAASLYLSSTKFEFSYTSVALNIYSDEPEFHLHVSIPLDHLYRFTHFNNTFLIVLK